jgi:hypothetical protein
MPWNGTENKNKDSQTGIIQECHGMALKIRIRI